MGDIMAKFTISGKIRLGEERKFTKELEAINENDAREKVYALFGSNNRLKRTNIIIENVTKV